MRLRRWIRRIFTRAGPRYCATCGRALAYSVLSRRSKSTGKATNWQWAAACPASSVLFSGIGSWSGNGHARTHTLIEYAGPPLWATPMQRALTMRRQVRSWLAVGYGETLRAGQEGGE